ncbi:MAG: hypothetical protein ACE5HE_14660, partial [Phycisphaerae bacterium]
VRNDGLEIVPLAERIGGRTVGDDVTLPGASQPILRCGQIISREVANQISASGLESVTIRSPLMCEAKAGVCAKCYGIDLSTGQLATPGLAAGVVAAQSIGEPMTQLTMRTFVFAVPTMLGHEAKRGRDQSIVGGMPRLDELFEAGRPPGEEESELRQQLDDMVRAQGTIAAADYLLAEIHRVYRPQGVRLDDRHCEIVVCQMLNKLQITDPGDTMFDKDEIVSPTQLAAANSATTGKHASAEPTIVGVTEAATATDDFFWFDFPFQWSRVSDANVNVTATNNAVLSGIRVSDANVNVTSTNDFFHPIVPKMWIRVTSATVNVAAGTNHFQAFRDISSGSVNVTGIVTGENWNLPDKRIGVGSSNVNVTATNVFVKVTQFTAWTRVSNANVNTTAANNSSSAFSRDTSGTVNVTATDDFSHVIGPVLFTRDASANVNVTATDSEHVTRSPVTTANVNVTATTNFVFTTQATGWFTKGRVYKHFAGDSTAFLVASIAGGPGGSQAFARLIEVDSNGNEIGPVGGASVATSNPAMQSIESVGFTLTVGKLYKVQFSNAGAAGTYSGASIVLR